jgi:hypothetical protein
MDCSTEGRPVISFRETTELYAHRQNLARCRRLLDTNLTAEQRRFVERRLAEEYAALERLSGSAEPKENTRDES